MPEPEGALSGKLQRLRRARLACECAKLDVAVEQAATEDVLAGETQWPEYRATVAE